MGFCWHLNNARLNKSKVKVKLQGLNQEGTYNFGSVYSRSKLEIINLHEVPGT